MSIDDRNIWSLNGLTGGIIATVLLLTIFAGLTMGALSVQQANATNYYDIKDESSIQMRSVDNINHLVDAK